MMSSDFCRKKALGRAELQPKLNQGKLAAKITKAQKLI